MEIRKLNMLRGLAALIVVVSHFSNNTNWLSASLGKGAGQIGVMLFFILSGFLISYLYLGKESNKYNIRKYAVARVARVVPLFLLLVILSYILRKFGISGVLYNIPDKESLMAHLFLIKGISVLWTIGPEIQFYLIFTLIWKVSTCKSGSVYIIIALTIIILFYTNIPRLKGSIGVLPYDFSLFRSLPYFLIGVIFGRFYISYKIPEHIQSGWFVFVLCLIPLVYPEIYTMITGAEYEMWSDIGVFVIVSMIFYCVVFLVPNSNSLMANKFGDFLGRVSYSLYLLHMPVLWQLKKYAVEGDEINLLILIIISLIVSYVSYRLIERPSSKYIRKLFVDKIN